MKIQLKRSNVLESGRAKAPTSSQMEYGEIAVNYNSVDPTIFIKDSSNLIVAITDNSAEIARLDAEINRLDGEIIHLDGEVNTINNSIITINSEIVDIKADVSNIDSTLITVNNEIDRIDSEVDAIQDILPSPITGSTHQDNTLDERYVSRFSWTDLPTL